MMAKNKFKKLLDSGTYCSTFLTIISCAVCVILAAFSFFLFQTTSFAASGNIKITSPLSGASAPSRNIKLSLSYSDPGLFAETTTWRIEVFRYRVASLPEGPDDFVSVTGGNAVYDDVKSRSGIDTFDVDLGALPGKMEITANLKAWTKGGYSQIATDKITVYYRPSATGGNNLPPATVDPSSSPSDNAEGGIIAGILAGLAVVGGGLVWLFKGRKGKSKGPAAIRPTSSNGVYKEAESVEDAARKLAEGRRSKALLDRYHEIRNIVWNDDRLLDFVDNARSSIIGNDGQINAQNLFRMESTLKRWIVRDSLGPKLPDYGGTEFYYDTVNQASHSIIIRGGMAYLTAGYSEMALNPVAALSNMRENINQGDSTFKAVAKGYFWSSFELGLGESGRLVKYARPLLDQAKDKYNLFRLSGVSQELSTEVSTINQMANQADDAARYSRDAFMESTEAMRAGETAATRLDHAEKLALELTNNPEFRKMLTENSKFIPERVKEVMGIAKQKVYQEARDKAVADVMQQMAKEGIPVEGNPYFIRQTGTHAQPGNPGWNSLKSDFDHTVEFGKERFNQLYEQRFNTHLESQGTSATAIDANVYGAGTSSPGAYSGGAMKFVEHYNSTSGSDIMIRAKDGVITISRETPQTSTSLLSRMRASDIQSAEANYQSFFAKDVAKGSSLENQIVNGSKTVSRNAGQYSVKYVENFQKTGSIKYQPPDAAKVADLIKKRGFSVDDAMKKVGYNGSKEQLLDDFKTIMSAK